MIDSLLQHLARSPSPEQQARLAHEAAPAVIRTETASRDLVAVLLSGMEPQLALQILFNCLDTARMAKENGQTGGAVFLDRAAAELAAAVRRGGIGPELLLSIASCYARAGLELPAALLLPTGSTAPVLAAGRTRQEARASLDDPSLALDDALDRVVLEGAGEPLQVHGMLSEMLAVLPLPVRGMAIHRVSVRPGAMFEKLACYWLLDVNAEIRRAAAQAVADRARRNALSSATLQNLERLLAWFTLPEERDRLKSHLQGVTSTVQSRGSTKAEAQRPKRGREQQVLISMPDGAGCQNLTISATRGRDRAVAVCLLKRGHGVKDAFVVPCRSAADQRSLIGEIASGVPMMAVPPDFAISSLRSAIADGFAANVLPAPGLLDVAELLDLPAGVTPAPTEPVAMLAALSPATRLLLDTKVKRKRLAGKESVDVWEDELFGSWFEQSEQLDDALATAESAAAAESAIWAQLEERRLWWAEQLAISASVADASPAMTAYGSAVMAAAAQCLLEGAALKSIEVMNIVARATVEAYAGRRLETGTSADAPKWMRDHGRGSSPAEVLAAAGLSSHFVEGWGAALAAAPREPSPMKAVEGLLERVVGVPMTSVDALLGEIFHQLDETRALSASGQALEQHLCALAPSERAEWCAGFASSVAATKRSWAKSHLSAEARTVLSIVSGADASNLDPLGVKILARSVAAMVGAKHG